MHTTTKRTTPETADPAIQPVAKRQRRVQHHVRVPGRFVPPSNPETIMWSQMRAIGLRSKHVEKLINRGFISKGELNTINGIIDRCTKKHIYPSGYEFGLLVHVAELFIEAIPVEEPDYDAPVEAKKRYLTDLGFPAAFVDTLCGLFSTTYLERSDAVDIAYDVACVGARLHCMEREGKIERGWFEDAVADPSLFAKLDRRALGDVLSIVCQ
ncbi:hypothetical protein [Medusavirus stheno T3]|uniref:Uncharacterized protein n=1 Tax=Medusavirus stheno T3 TaxID=3069717 RepID=A0A7S8BDI1_9VIRU|nr:hypothetical protein QKU73_gp028 [Acanthamoeba castellanii medusavirus]QPB44209.1 hypothetical protein [Medusavirus stheno T3]